VSHALPEVNELVRICVADDRQGQPSRVEDSTATTLVLAAPSYAGDLLTTRVGMAALVRWTGARGLFEVDVALDRVRRHDAVAVWEVHPTSEVRVQQRRRYARVRAELPMVFVPRADTPAEVVNGTGVDLSEGGLRARVPAGAIVEGARLQARFALDDEAVSVLGSVIKVAVAGRQAEVVVIFEEPVADEAVIRRWVLRQQILARRKAAR
jgi:c-di-GMP-binding flagellar brake protein YcgR